VTKPRLKKAIQSKLIDILAFSLYKLLTFAPAFLYEVAYVGITVKQYLVVRLLKNVLLFALSFLCRDLRDKIKQYIPGSSDKQLGKAVAEGTALSLYQLPFYVVSMLVIATEVSSHELSIASVIYFSINVLTGRLYGVLLDQVRLRFVPDPEQS
jgi:hypothetical protein